MVTIHMSDAADRSYQELPIHIKKKADRQLRQIAVDFRHPSLRVKKMKGFQDRFEARIDRQYRFAFSILGEVLYILTIGPHDEGLGKK